MRVPLKAAGLPSQEVTRRTDSVLGDLGLVEVTDHLIEELSGGQQQRVALARALADKPTVVLANEVTAELDAVTQQRALE